MVTNLRDAAEVRGSNISVSRFEEIVKQNAPNAPHGTVPNAPPQKEIPPYPSELSPLIQAGDLEWVDNLFVQDDTGEGIVDLNLAVVFDKAQFPEFAHEKIDSETRCSDHLRQHLLRYFGKRVVGMAWCAVTC